MLLVRFEVVVSLVEEPAADIVEPGVAHDADVDLIFIGHDGREGLLSKPLSAMPPEWSNRDRARASYRLRQPSRARRGLCGDVVHHRPQGRAIPGLLLARPGRHRRPG